MYKAVVTRQHEVIRVAGSVVDIVIVLDGTDLRQLFKCRSQNSALDQVNGIFGFVVQGLWLKKYSQVVLLQTTF